MRYCPHSVETIKSKAKLLKRYLSNPLMEAPTLSLTAIQQIIARGLGFATWAEMTIEIERTSGAPDAVMPDQSFLRFAEVLSSVIHRPTNLCAAVIFRLGFCPDSPDLSIGKKKLLLSEQALLFDLILDRFVELDSSSMEYVTARSRLLDLHRDLLKEHANEWRNWAPKVGAFPRGILWSQREILIDWVGSIINLSSPPGAALAKNTVDGTRWDPWRTKRHRSKMLEPSRLVAPFERGDIPRTGLLVMTGENMSGRTFSSILLTVANRRLNRTLFPTFLRLYNDPFAGGLPQGYLGEIRDMSELAGIIPDAEKQLVIVQLSAGSVESAYSRTYNGLARHLGSRRDEWVSQHLIGGYHHSFFANDHVLTSRVTFWKGSNARFTDAAKAEVTVAGGTEL